MLILNGVLAYPIWGLLSMEAHPDIYDPLWLRLLISGFMLSLLCASFILPKKRSFLQSSLIASGWLLTLHTFWICWQSHLSYLALCGVLILACSLLNIFPTKKSTFLLGLAYALFGAVVVFIDHQWEVSPIIVNIVLWSAIVPSISANFTRMLILESLWTAQEESRALIQNMSEGLIGYSPQGHITAMNPSAFRILGISEKELLSQKMKPEWICFDEEGQKIDRNENPMAQIFQTGEAIRDKVLGISRPDGGIVWLKINASTFQNSPDHLEKSVLFTFTDISEMKNSQKIISDQKRRLDATAKLAALGEISAGVAHEINNPLAIIEGKVFNILRSLKSNKFSEPLETSLEKISSTVFRIQKITKGLQAFSSGGNNDDPFSKIKFSALLEDALSFCNERIEKSRAQIKIDCEIGLELECRPIQISQVLVNLIQNACDAIEHQKNPWIQIWARSAHNLLVITVTDSGNGIPQEIREKIMQPFFTTKDVGQGTGLGLSISQGLLNSHLGRIWVEPRSSHTTFVVELPLEQSSLQRAS
jgi:PAS domain S-box-containing protein